MIKITSAQANELMKIMDKENLVYEKEWYEIQRHRKQEIKKFLKENYGRNKLYENTYHFKFMLMWLHYPTVSDILIDCNIKSVNEYIESIS